MKGFVVFSLFLCGLLIKFDPATCSYECEAEHNSPEALRINVFSKKTRTGKWQTEFRAYKDDSPLEEDGYFDVQVTQDVVLCGGRRQVTIQGKITSLEVNDTFREKELHFHQSTGNNVKLFNAGRTAEKLIVTETGYGLAFTHRPLRDNELFEVILEKKTNHFKNSLGIGISTSSPANMIVPKFITEVPPPSWSMYYDVIYHNAQVARRGYGKSLDTLVVGDRVGIMRRSNGGLHIFINGEDQGEAASNVPPNVYGVAELYANAARVTIVKH
ncbi:neuralized-like protein 4 [Ischnura elegans]|uniref:neuralized-like protein 4 n=1 Tax=Ischnura elegans TaxID=197161 RepID=UPI001ED87D6B|nr:neuralized-like protein 4 [Ischnura elegans]